MNRLVVPSRGVAAVLRCVLVALWVPGLALALCGSTLYGSTLYAQEADQPDLPISAAKPAHGERVHPAEAVAHGGADRHGPKLGELLPFYATLPFALLLGCVALMPLAAPHWWEHNSSKAIVAAVLAIPVAGLLFSYGAPGLHALEHAGKEYVSFILLLGSLFIISGGIYFRGTLRGRPALNVGIMGFGAVLANLVGTTGASMLLIRPLLRANEHRSNVVHIVVFFIFTVSNCGGLLTPLGDPPLFLGFLKGVPFEWTLRLAPEWLFVNVALLAIFFVWDTWMLSREHLAPPKEEANAAPVSLETNDPTDQETLGLEGVNNFALLGMVIAAIYCAGQNVGQIGAAGEPWPWGLQELVMGIAALISLATTSQRVRRLNRFTYGPIIEVAVLFAGIFVTMIPALAILNVQGRNLGLSEPWQYFWVAGLLSSVLDNAPTYLTFAVTASGIAGIEDTGRYLLRFLQEGGPEAADILAAISCGAVFMGANTYIGNGPNFMVKAIAEENNVRMPSFFGYMLYSGGVLIPLFALVSIVFFR